MYWSPNATLTWDVVWPQWAPTPGILQTTFTYVCIFAKLFFHNLVTNSFVDLFLPFGSPQFVWGGWCDPITRLPDLFGCREVHLLEPKRLRTQTFDPHQYLAHFHNSHVYGNTNVRAQINADGAKSSSRLTQLWVCPNQSVRRETPRESQRCKSQEGNAPTPQPLKQKH